MKKEEEEEKEEEEVGKREGERCSSAWLTNTGSHQSWKMKRRKEEKERGWEKEGSLMGAVNPTTLEQPSFSSSTSQQKIYAGALSIPRVSRQGSVEDGADKWTASEGPGQPCVILVRLVLNTPPHWPDRTDRTPGHLKNRHQGSDQMDLPISHHSPPHSYGCKRSK